MSKIGSATRVFIVDDHPLVVEALQVLISHDDQFVVCGSASTGAQAVADIAESMPDVVVLDLGLPDISGQDLIGFILNASPDVKVLVLTATRSTSALQLAMDAGAYGVIIKTAVSSSFMSALRDVAAGTVFIDQVLAMAAKETPSLVENLSGREHSVLRLIAQGMATKQVASELGIGPKTVETHKARALAKLGLSSRADIFRFARLQGWLHED